MGEIGLVLVKTLASYLFGAYLKSHFGSLELEGAPFWYGREDSDEICVSSFSNGGLEKLDLTKEKVKIKLTKKLSNILEEIANEHFKNLKEDEEEYLYKIINDKKIKFFVNHKIYFKNQKIDEGKNRVFVRGCIKKDDFINFEKKRIKEISKDMTFYKAKKAFDELEKE